MHEVEGMHFLLWVRQLHPQQEVRLAGVAMVITEEYRSRNAIQGRHYSTGRPWGLVACECAIHLLVSSNKDDHSRRDIKFCMTG